MTKYAECTHIRAMLHVSLSLATADHATKPINALSIKLLRTHRREDVNLRAAWTMSINDFVSNFGIIIAGVLVTLLGRSWPDLAVAFAIAAIATYGGIKTLRDAFGNQK